MPSGAVIVLLPLMQPLFLTKNGLGLEFPLFLLPLLRFDGDTVGSADDGDTWWQTAVD